MNVYSKEYNTAHKNAFLSANWDGEIGELKNLWDKCSYNPMIYHNVYEIGIDVHYNLNSEKILFTKTKIPILVHPDFLHLKEQNYEELFDLKNQQFKVRSIYRDELVDKNERSFLSFTNKMYIISSNKCKCNCNKLTIFPSKKNFFEEEVDNEKFTDKTHNCWTVVVSWREKKEYFKRWLNAL